MGEFSKLVKKVDQNMIDDIPFLVTPICCMKLELLVTMILGLWY